MSVLCSIPLALLPATPWVDQMLTLLPLRPWVQGQCLWHVQLEPGRPGHAGSTLASTGEVPAVASGAILQMFFGWVFPVPQEISTTGDVLPLLMEQQHARVHPASLVCESLTGHKACADRGRQRRQSVLLLHGKTVVPVLPDVAAVTLRMGYLPFSVFCLTFAETHKSKCL